MTAHLPHNTTQQHTNQLGQQQTSVSGRRQQQQLQQQQNSACHKGFELQDLIAVLFFFFS